MSRSAGMSRSAEAGKSGRGRNEPQCRSEKEQPEMNFQACSG